MIGVRAAWVPSEAARESPFCTPLRAAGGLLSVFGVLWLVDASPPTSSFSLCAFLSLCPNVLF